LTLVATQNASVTLCQQPVRDRTTRVKVIAMVGFAIAAVAVVLRLISRAVGEGTFVENSGLDDGLVVLAMILVGGISSCSIICEQAWPRSSRTIADEKQ